MAGNALTGQNLTFIKIDDKYNNLMLKYTHLKPKHVRKVIAPYNEFSVLAWVERAILFYRIVTNIRNN